MAADNCESPLSPSAELDAQVAELSYEEARDQLTETVRQLETGNISLTESLALWERGEALGRRCQAWLDGAQARLEAARTNLKISADASSDTSSPETSPTPSVEEQE